MIKSKQAVKNELDRLEKQRLENIKRGEYLKKQHEQIKQNDLQKTKPTPPELKSSEGSQYRLKKLEDGRYYIQYKEKFLFFFFYWVDLVEYGSYGGSWLKTFKSEKEAIDFVHNKIQNQEKARQRKIAHQKEKYVKYL